MLADVLLTRVCPRAPSSLTGRAEKPVGQGLVNSLALVKIENKKA